MGKLYKALPGFPFLRKKFPVSHQPHPNYAAVCCLKMVAGYYGKKCALDSLIKKINPDQSPLSLQGIVSAANAIGFETMAVQLSFDDLIENDILPCVIHWKSNHFIVVYKIKDDDIYVADPEKGLCHYKKDAFLHNWYIAAKNTNAGIALLLAPDSTFFHQKSEQETIRYSRVFIYLTGLRKAFITRKRRFLRSIVANTPASPIPPAAPPLVVHMLLGKTHLDMAICSCKSLNLSIGAACIFLFHDDGSLNTTDITKLLSQFPGSRVIDRPTADRMAADKLAAYPHCKFVRDNNFMWLKFFDVFFWSEKERVAYVDSDILFFKKPVQFIREFNDANGNNLFNRDVDNGYYYSLNPDDLESLTGQLVAPSVNAGLWVLDHTVLNLDQIEKWLSSPIVSDVILDYFLDQTFIAALASINGKETLFLDEGYDISLVKLPTDAVCKHYVKNIRNDYELQGLSFLLRKSNFRREWRRFTQQ